MNQSRVKMSYLDVSIFMISLVEKDLMSMKTIGEMDSIKFTSRFYS